MKFRLYNIYIAAPGFFHRFIKLYVVLPIKSCFSASLTGPDGSGEVQFFVGDPVVKIPAFGKLRNIVCNAISSHLETSIKKIKFAYKIKTMKTISVSISDLEYTQLGINNDQISFIEFVDLVNK